MILFYDAHGFALALNYYRGIASFPDTRNSTQKNAEI
jgi:hypothetical protein